MEYMQTLENIRANIRRVIIGKDAVIDHLLISLLCSGHVLIEDMPWPRQNHPGERPRGLSRLLLPAHPVHP